MFYLWRACLKKQKDNPKRLATSEPRTDKKVANAICWQRPQSIFKTGSSGLPLLHLHVFFTEFDVFYLWRVYFKKAKKNNPKWPATSEPRTDKEVANAICWQHPQTIFKTGSSGFPLLYVVSFYGLFSDLPFCWGRRRGRRVGSRAGWRRGSARRRRNRRRAPATPAPQRRHGPGPIRRSVPAPPRSSTPSSARSAPIGRNRKSIHQTHGDFDPIYSIWSYISN